MQILIIGGTSFIGPYVVRQLYQVGHDIAVFHRGQTEADLPPQVKHIHGGWVENLANFLDDFRRLNPEIILYMMPIGEQDSQIVMNAFKGIARRLVAISSIDVYRAYGRMHQTEPGPIEPMPLPEDASLRQVLYPYRSQVKGSDDPIYYYDKILAEQVIMNDPDLPGTVLRLPMVYGPEDYFHRLYPYVKRMEDHRLAILLEEQAAQWRSSRGYVENVATAIVLAIVDDRATHRIYNVAEENTLSEAEWIRAIGRAMQWNGKIVVMPKEHLPTSLISESNLAQHWIVDSTRIRQELGYKEPVSREEAIRRTVAWEQAHPPKEIDPKLFDYAAEDAILAQLQ